MVNLGARRRLVSLLAFVTAVLVVVSAAASAESRGNQEKVRVAVFASALTSYTVPAVNNAKKVFASQASITVFDARFDAQRQAGQCQDAIATGRFDGFVIYSVDGASMVPCAREAIKDGIKVVSWDYPPIGQDPLNERLQVPGMLGNVLLSIRVDVRAAVNLTRLACAGANPCKVAMTVAAPAFGYSAVKRKLTLEEFKKYPSIKVVDEGVTGFDDPDKAFSIVRTMLQKTPDLKVILGDDDSSMHGGDRAVKEAGLSGKVRTIGDGASKTGVQAIRNGSRFGTVVSRPVTGARIATQMVIDAVRGKAIVKRVVIVQLLPSGCKNAMVTRACAGKFTPEW